MITTLGIVTTSRSDYGIYRPILRAIRTCPDMDLMLFAGGMHLSPDFGMTVQTIEEDGYPIAERVPLPIDSDTPQGMAWAIAAGLAEFAQAFERSRPDALFVLGDRFEMFAAAGAAAALNLPIAHIHGGELSYGAIDDSFRHAITKLSHLHFVAAKSYADRIIRMGEEPWRVMVSGAPALDELIELPLPNLAAFEAKYRITLHPAPLLVTFHPVTLELKGLEHQVAELFAALEKVGMAVLFTQPNADPGGRLIRERIHDYVSRHANAWYVANFGPLAYWDALRMSAAMVGNSSSGIIEAPSFGVPVVNIGTRQDGRIRAKNVIDVGYDRDEIVRAIEQATALEFRRSLEGMKNPYGDGHAAERILAKLKTIELGDRLIRKVFYDGEAGA